MYMRGVWVPMDQSRNLTSKMMIMKSIKVIKESSIW